MRVYLGQVGYRQKGQPYIFRVAMCISVATCDLSRWLSTFLLANRHISQNLQTAFETLSKKAGFKWRWEIQLVLHSRRRGGGEEAQPYFFKYSKLNSLFNSLSLSEGLQ